MPRNFDLKARVSKLLSKLRPSKANDLEGPQDMGGKHGGQAGVPKPTARPRTTANDNDVVPKRSQKKPSR